MTLEDAISLLPAEWKDASGHFADLGAGTGTFIHALDQLLDGGTIYALDKNPHALWSLRVSQSNKMEVIEGNFFQAIDLPEQDGIIMANALHYAKNPLSTLRNFVLPLLKPGGIFVLIEYDTNAPNPPWNPFPIPKETFLAWGKELPFTSMKEIGQMPSIYSSASIYSLSCQMP